MLVEAREERNKEVLLGRTELGEKWEIERRDRTRLGNGGGVEKERGGVRTVVGKKEGKEEVEMVGKESSGFKKWYIRFAETVNGRLAAAGFLLCLMREMWEPGHPSLAEQVQQVVTPLAAHTPGFIVAVYAGVVDMFT